MDLHDALLEKLKEIYELLKEGKEVKIRLSSRGFLNIRFDEVKGLIKLGEKLSEREFFNAAHVRRFVQTILVASRVIKLLESGKHASQREMYYQLKHHLPFSKENTFECEAETIKAIEDLERLFRGKAIREQFHITADRRGALFGDIVIVDKSIPGEFAEFVPAKLGRGGWAIPSTIEEIEIKDINADYVLVIESAAMYERLIEEGFPKKSRAILITTQGQASRGVRRLLNRLRYEYNLPIIVFNDCDPWGFYIYFVLKSGSMNLAYLSEKLAIPDAKYVGMCLEDIKRYRLTNVLEKLKEVDVKRAKEMLRYPWISRFEEWKRELSKMIELKVRLEQQALASKSLEFVAEKYLPEKIENKIFLP